MDRFVRQTRFAPFGEVAQSRLQRARIAVVGLGGLGSTIAEQLTRAGAGELRLIDRDVVEEHNLPRQTLYTQEDAQRGLPKAEAAAQHLQSIGGPTRFEVRVADLSRRTVEGLLEDVDLVLDGLDNFAGRFLLNDHCHRNRRPWIYGGAVASTGIVLLVPAGGQPCLRCLFPEVPGQAETETCETVGVLSPLPALIASLQVCEAMRHFAGEATSRLWHLDPWQGRALASPVPKGHGQCPCCDERTHPALTGPVEAQTAKLCGRDTVQVLAEVERTVDLASLAQRWQGLGEVQETRFLVRLTVGEEVISAFQDGRALVQGTSSLERARSLYARYIGC